MNLDELTYWQAVFAEQTADNLDEWVQKLKESEDPGLVISQEYGNLLQIIETSLENPALIDTLLDLCLILFPIVITYADWKRWLVYLEQAMINCDENAQPLQKTNLQERIGDLHWQTNNFDTALENFEQCKKNYQAYEQPKSYVRVLAKIAGIYALQGRYVEGFKLCEEALAIIQPLQAYSYAAHVHMSLANLHLYTNNLNQSQHHAEIAYKYYKQHSDKTMAMRALGNVLTTAINLKEWDKAAPIAEELESYYIATQNTMGLLRMKLSLGIGAFETNNYLEAERLWRECWQLHKETNSQDLILASIQNNLGLAYTKLGLWEDAYEMYMSALQLFRGHALRYDYANTMDNLVDLYVAQGKTVAACQTLSEAIAYSERLLPTVPSIIGLLEEMKQKQQTLSCLDMGNETTIES